VKFRLGASAWWAFPGVGGRAVAVAMKIIEGKLRVAASDVANFLACQELTQLDLRAARGTLWPPHPRDLGFEDLVRRGEEHESGVLERFRADGYEVADLGGAGDPAGATAAAIQRQAIQLPRMGSERIRTRPRAIVTSAPALSSSVAAGRFAASRAAC
jgi:hypothetical protein